MEWLGYQSMFVGVDEWFNDRIGADYESSKIKTFGTDGASFSGYIGLYVVCLMIICGFIGLLLVLKLISHRAGGCSQLLTKIQKTIKRKIFFNSFLRIMITGSLGFDHLICTLLFILTHAEEEHKNSGLLAVVAICFVIMVVVPPFIGYMLLKYRGRLQELNVKRKIDSLYLAVRTNHKKSTLYTPAFMVRRMLLVMFAIFNQGQQNWLIITFIQQQVFYLVYLVSAMAHFYPSENLIELINEFALLCIGYLLIFATDYVPIVEIQY